MPSTVVSRVLLGALLALAARAVLAKEVPPRVLQEPVFGLRVQSSNPALEMLSEEARSKCFELADNEDLTGRMWIFARVDEAGATYYVVGGYFERLHPDKGEARYRLDTVGGVYKIDSANCMGYGAAREVFDVPAFEEISLPIRQRLAADLASRLSLLFGGPDRLRTAMRARTIDAERLSPELRGAFHH